MRYVYIERESHLPPPLVVGILYGPKHGSQNTRIVVHSFTFFLGLNQSPQNIVL